MGQRLCSSGRLHWAKAAFTPRVLRFAHWHSLAGRKCGSEPRRLKHSAAAGGKLSVLAGALLYQSPAAACLGISFNSLNSSCLAFPRPFYVNIDTCFLRPDETIEFGAELPCLACKPLRRFAHMPQDSRGVRPRLQGGPRVWGGEAETDDRVPGSLALNALELEALRCAPHVCRIRLGPPAEGSRQLAWGGYLPEPHPKQLVTTYHQSKPTLLSFSFAISSVIADNHGR